MVEQRSTKFVSQTIGEQVCGEESVFLCSIYIPIVSISLCHYCFFTYFKQVERFIWTDRMLPHMNKESENKSIPMKGNMMCPHCE